MRSPPPRAAPCPRRRSLLPLSQQMATCIRNAAIGVVHDKADVGGRHRVVGRDHASASRSLRNRRRRKPAVRRCRCSNRIRSGRRRCRTNGSPDRSAASPSIPTTTCGCSIARRPSLMARRPPRSIRRRPSAAFPRPPSSNSTPTASFFRRGAGPAPGSSGRRRSTGSSSTTRTTSG